MIEAPTVDALMAGGLSQWLESQTAMRQEAKAKVRQRTIISIAAGIILFFIIWAIFGIGAGFFAGAMVGGAGQLWAAAARTPVVNAIKQEMNSRIAAAMGCKFTHTASPCPEFTTARTFEMLPSYDREAYEDQWQGEVAGRPFNLYEAHLQEWRGSGKNRRLETVFRGVLMTVGFAREFHGSTLIEREGNHMTLFGMRDSITIEGVKLERVKMVDPRFEDDFTVWSTDQVEARYLVHPAYVERLIAIEDGFSGQKVRALFHGGNLVIALEARDQFESGSLDAENDRQRMARTIEQFAALANLAQALNERPRG
jgi:hypothetical protein